MNAPSFHTRHAPGVEAARLLSPVAPQPSVAEKLASGVLYVLTDDDARDLPYLKGPIIPDYKLRADYLLCRRSIGEPTFRVYLNVPLCQGCDSPAPTGICLECEA